MCHFARRPLWALTALAGILGGASLAHAYSTKVHLLTGHYVVQQVKRNNCKIRLTDWNKGKRKATKEYLAAVGGPASRVVKLNSKFCGLLKNYSQYFVPATAGPDTYPGAPGNTDPTHALLWNAPWQFQVIWQNAKTPQEQAFTLGWLFHMAGDALAHGLANLHARGVWMEGGKPSTVYRHIMAEVYYADYLLPYPKGFDNRLMWPKDFVTRLFFNPNSVLYQHYDYLLTRHSLWAKSKGGPEVGMVAKVFGMLYRAMFLLWDFHGREMHRWKGHADYYKPRKGKSVSDYFHWLFADQAYNLHKKKMAAMKEVISAWYEADVRAGQAMVADKRGKFDGKKKYDKVYYTLGKKRVKRNVYKSGGVGGILDAYKYLGEYVQEYLSPNIVTITNENFPTLRKILDGLKKVGKAALWVVDKIKAALGKLKDLLLKPFKLLGAAIMKWLQPAVDKLKRWVVDNTICREMPKMCKSLDNQGKAFGVVKGKLATYMNWPIFHNTITLGALLLEKLQSVNKDQGNETLSPYFGSPSGDFGCTDSCLGARREYSRLFMPMAGKYYQNATISRVMPDYCMESTHKRRTIPLNDTYGGKSNDQTNGGFTCLVSSGGNQKPAVKKAVPRVRTPVKRRIVPIKRIKRIRRKRIKRPVRRRRFGSLDVARTIELALGRRASSQGAACFTRRLKRRLRKVVRRVRRPVRRTKSRCKRVRYRRGRRTYFKTVCPKAAPVKRAVVRRAKRAVRRPTARRPRPVRAGAIKPRLAIPIKPVVPTGSCSNDVYAPLTGKRGFPGEVGKVFQPIYDAVVGRWDFRTHPAAKDRIIVRPTDNSFCYAALKWGPKTRLKGLPNVDTENRKFYKKTSYSLTAMIGNLLAPLAELLKQGVTYVYNWAKQKLTQAVDAVKKKVTELANKAKAWVQSTTKKIGDFFKNAWNKVSGFFKDASHRFHTNCMGHVSDLAKKTGQGVVTEAKARANQFFAHLRASLAGLNAAQKKQAIDPHWNALKTAIRAQVAGARSKGVSKVRGWATLGSTKRKHENKFKQVFDQYAKVDAALNAIYASNMR